MESRKPIKNLAKSIHSLLGLKTHLNSTWVESVCNIIKKLPPPDEPSCGSSEYNDDGVQSAVLRIQDDLDVLMAHLNQLNLQRKQALNDFLDLKGRIRVFCRIKPMNMGEKFQHHGVVEASTSNNVLLKLHENKSKTYTFDKVFHPDTSQDEVFSEVEPVIKSVLDGYNACIFAYGQTGTGKTFTMEGEPDCPGVMPRAIDALFKQAMDSNHTFLYTFSMLEIYMGNLRDLLVPRMTQSTDPTRQCLSIQADPKGGIEIDNLVAIRVSDINQAKRLYRLGSRFRATASTNCNATSSRSHCLIRISLTCLDAPERRRETNKIWMVDLGGSERVLKTKARGKRFEEGKAINLSLSALGDVISALQRKTPHVPYRNSKLTQVLKDCLEEDSKTLMLVHVSPEEEDLCESLCSLSFAARVRSTQLGYEESTANKETAMGKLLQKVKQLEFEREDVRKDIKKLQDRLEHLTRTLPSSDEHLLAFHPYNEVLQANLEIEKQDDQTCNGSPSSKLPRFMRPTICSRKKYGIDLTNMESGQRKDRTHTRKRRTSSARAESITFPVKGISEYGSDYSISRTSCLVGSNMKYSADYETEYSYGVSEYNSKSVISTDDDKSERPMARLNSNPSHESYEGYENKKEEKIYSPNNLTVDNRFCLQKNETTNLRGKKVLVGPVPKKRNRSNAVDKAKILHSQDVHNHEFTNKRISHDEEIKKLARVGVTQWSTTEMVMAESQNSFGNFVIKDSGSKHSSPDDKVIEETQQMFNDCRIKDNSLVSPPDMGCDGLDQNKDYRFLTRMPGKQVKKDENLNLKEDFRTKDSGCNPLFPYDTGNNTINLSKEVHHHVLKSELESGSPSWPTEISNETAVLPNKILETQQKSQQTLPSDKNICKEERDNGEICVSPQHPAGLTKSCSQNIRSRKDLFMNQKDANKERFTISIIGCHEKLQNTGQNLKSTEHTGICDLLRQKIQILHSSALLGLGVQSLGFGHDFFHGLML